LGRKEKKTKLFSDEIKKEQRKFIVSTLPNEPFKLIEFLEDDLISIVGLALVSTTRSCGGLHEDGGGGGGRF
jgi:hypothetical protein